MPPARTSRVARVLVSCVALWAITAATSARADLWGYVDENGRSHMSTEKLDERYQLFFKGAVRVNVPVVASSPVAAAELKAQEAFRNTTLFQRMSSQPNVKRFEALIHQFAVQHKVDPALVKAVIAVESAFQPDAVSPKGALGLMQIIPDTGARYGIAADKKRTAAQKLLDPATNVRIGVLHLSNLLALFPGNLELVLAAYNAGENAVQRYDNKVPPYPETREYVKLVRQFYSIYQPPPSPAPVTVADTRIVVPGQRTAPGLLPRTLVDARAGS
ncbi:MAG: lytic transglycosylase domain-containing protein [Betaproteobacteria bacterium]